MGTAPGGDAWPDDREGAPDVEDGRAGGGTLRRALKFAPWPVEAWPDVPAEIVRPPRTEGTEKVAARGREDADSREGRRRDIAFSLGGGGAGSAEEDGGG